VKLKVSGELGCVDAASSQSALGYFAQGPYVLIVDDCSRLRSLHHSRTVFAKSKMLVVGTPRPSSILGEVTDNGFFEKSSSSRSSSADDEDIDGNLYQATPRDDSKLDDLDNTGDLWGSGDDAGDGRRGSRSRSESFHEMYDEKAKTSPIVLAGDQPLLARQLSIVTNLNPTTYEAKPKAWGTPSKEELAEEELLEKEEQIALEKWRSAGGRGKPDSNGSDANVKRGRKKSLLGSGSSQTTASSALVPSAGGVPVVSTSILGMELLPRYEDRVQILVIMPSIGTHKDQESPLELKALDFQDVAGRRVHCVLWQLSSAEKFEEPVLEAYLKACDAVCLLQPPTDWSNSIISRAVELERTVVVTGAFGANPADAKRNAAKLNVHFDPKGSLWAEIAARDIVLKSARARGESKYAIGQMEKQLKRTEKGKPNTDGPGANGGGSGGSCVLV